MPGTSNRRGWIAGAVVLALAALCLAGCGSGSAGPGAHGSLVNGNVLYDCLSHSSPEGADDWEVYRNDEDESSEPLPAAHFSPDVGSGLISIAWGRKHRGYQNTQFSLAVLPDTQAATAFKSGLAASVGARPGQLDDTTRVKRNVVFTREPQGPAFLRNHDYFPRPPSAVRATLRDCMSEARTADAPDAGGPFVACDVKGVGEVLVRRGSCAFVSPRLLRGKFPGEPPDEIKRFFPDGFVSVSQSQTYGAIDTYYLGNGQTDVIYGGGV